MNHRLFSWGLALVCALVLSPRIYAQGGATSTLSGIVADTSGGR